MGNIVIELTNECNLRCRHCLEGRHNADGFLKVEIIEKVLQSACNHGYKDISFTGGEPTLHPEFTKILDMVCKAGYKYGFVTNGWNFTEIFENLLPFRNGLTAITFSLDGAKEETHDMVRGKGSYRKIMQAVSICVVKDLPFTINTTITTNNYSELEEIAILATKLRSHGLRFGHLLSNSQTTMENFDLSPLALRKADIIIHQLQETYGLTIVLAPGYYTSDIFPCSSLQMHEMNIDWQGNVSMCCHLSGYGKDLGDCEVIGNLDEVSFSEAYERLIESVKKFRKEKVERHKNSEFEDSDYFPCRYCLNYFEKTDWHSKYSVNHRFDKN